MGVPTTALSKLVSRMLRHEPARHGLELDAEGWVGVDALLSAVRRHGPRWASVERDDFEAMIATSAKRRHEMAGSRIRARYGHSLPGRFAKEPREPPSLLFHGTAPGTVAKIRASGLRPMRRQYVHLSVDHPTALAVGRRKSRDAVVLRIDAGRAFAAGVAFYPGNETVWLAERVPPEYVAPADGG